MLDLAQFRGDQILVAGGAASWRMRKKLLYCFFCIRQVAAPFLAEVCAVSDWPGVHKLTKELTYMIHQVEKNNKEKNITRITNVIKVKMGNIKTRIVANKQ